VNITDIVYIGIPALSKALLEHPDPYKPFLPFLSQSSNPEDPIPLLTSTVLALLMDASTRASPSGTQAMEKALPKLFSYLSTLAKSSDGGLQDIAVLEYSTLLRGKKSRELFWEQRAETVAPLIEILKTDVGVGWNGDSSTIWSGAVSVRSGIDSLLSGRVGVQLLYHVLLVMWQLSFEGSTIGDGLAEYVVCLDVPSIRLLTSVREYDIILLYTQLLRLSEKEKLIRLLVATMYNLLSTNQNALLPQATLARLPSVLQNLNSRKLTDTDLLDDLSKLKDLLDEHTATQTNFDEYASEVNTGHLRWSPTHRNPTFWAENARRILDHEKGELPRKLAEIMAKPWDNDKQVLAIACNDIGCLVKEVPERRQQLEKLGLKARIMELMAEPDDSVKLASLNALAEWLRYSLETK